jgi:hypothetical protein
MNDFPRRIPKTKHVLICPAKIDSMMTGVSYAEVDSNYRITLVYVDDTRESRDSTRPEVLSMDGFLPLVSFVQAGRV